MKICGHCCHLNTSFCCLVNLPLLTNRNCVYESAHFRLLHTYLALESSPINKEDLPSRGQSQHFDGLRFAASALCGCLGCVIFGSWGCVRAAPDILKEGILHTGMIDDELLSS
ncbi:hypothetical protein CDAR_78121 [Caerostris darwini]|uniref:Uncharacterized protein n=1 Tax=Caerostris darwini TaxID=1538125 RepID=A0AAV4SI94_9ARAC|nr:hypothetical protein CDAR_78121 [Caerostris darwini]